MASSSVDTAIRTLLRERPSFSSSDLSELTGLTRQGLQRHLARAIRDGWLVREGRGRATAYGPAEPAGFEASYTTDGLEEALVWSELQRALPELAAEGAERADEILQYVVTEMVNNAIDHSESPRVEVRAFVRGTRVDVTVADAGIGALESVRRHFSLEGHLAALQELSKGKVTTQPEHHTGEGIFFSTKMTDHFELSSNGLAWIVDNELQDQAVREIDEGPGTRVRFDVELETERAPAAVFGAYTHDFEFDTTRCVIRLFEYGTRFVSRSEAKRLVSGLDKFREVILDFRGVTGVGQGFVDEVFRVWARDHAQVRLIPEHMNEAVEFMVRRGMPPSGRR